MLSRSRSGVLALLLFGATASILVIVGVLDRASPRFERAAQVEPRAIEPETFATDSTDSRSSAANLESAPSATVGTERTAEAKRAADPSAAPDAYPKSARKTATSFDLLAAKPVEQLDLVNARALTNACIALILDARGAYTLTGRKDVLTSKDWPATADRSLAMNGRRYWISYAEFPALRAVDEFDARRTLDPLPLDLVSKLRDLVQTAKASAAH